MRALLGLLLAGVLILTGAYPSLAPAVAGLLLAALGLALHGALALLAQPAVLGLALAGLLLTSLRGRRLA